jgi:hypothetical protein
VCEQVEVYLHAFLRLEEGDLSASCFAFGNGALRYRSDWRLVGTSASVGDVAKTAAAAS